MIDKIINKYLNEAPFSKRIGKSLSPAEITKLSKTFDGIDKDMENRLIASARRTWDIIAGDIFQSLADEGIDTMKREEVIEVVCDAGYMHTYGRDDEAYAYFRYLIDNKGYSYVTRLMKKAFPYAKYS